MLFWLVSYKSLCVTKVKPPAVYKQRNEVNDTWALEK
jgi:hypothetical protein